LAGRFFTQSHSGKLTKLLIDQWKKLIHGKNIASFDSSQNTRDLTHICSFYPPILLKESIYNPHISPRFSTKNALVFKSKTFLVILGKMCKIGKLVDKCLRKDWSDWDDLKI
jgi:hypothetical protein